MKAAVQGLYLKRFQACKNTKHLRTTGFPE